MSEPAFALDWVKSQRWLRNTKDGTIYPWREVLAANPLCEEVTPEQAFPQWFIPEGQEGRDSGLDLTTSDVPDEPPTETDPGLAKDASRGLAGKAAGLVAGLTGGKDPNAKQPTVDPEPPKPDVAS